MIAMDTIGTNKEMQFLRKGILHFEYKLSQELHTRF